MVGLYRSETWGFLVLEWSETMTTKGERREKIEATVN